ncbi:hypothetical protein [uncultured Jatrophihabitans sp.]|uniref:hypothetical protein n=1 Tax=uncultured Jatrophihabitans sp. TaxID=1610747 RepID=UPI0035C9CF76
MIDASGTGTAPRIAAAPGRAQILAGDRARQSSDSGDLLFVPCPSEIRLRSDVSGEDSIKLDLRYVENWSLATDTAVVLKTARAVLAARAAY